jgi:hypothetical protein
LWRLEDVRLLLLAGLGRGLLWRLRLLGLRLRHLRLGGFFLSSGVLTALWNSWSTSQVRGRDR